MTIFQVSEALTHIRDRYIAIVRMCETFNIESNPDRYSEFISQRAVLLNFIEQDQLRLNSESTDWIDLCNMDSALGKIRDEIGTFITTVLALDETIKQRLMRKMSSVRKELSSYQKSSKATLAYARHA
jgi:uncharacterized protein YutD